MKIIYPLPDGGVAIIHPTDLLPVSDVALKDVPPGVPYKIIADSDIPDDRSFRDSWTADFSDPDGHGIGPEEWIKQKTIEVKNDQD